MALKLKNRWEYVDDDWWNWEAFIDGTPNELDQIKEVEYILHPTFVEPVRKVRARATKFCMQTEGWGAFKLKAYVTKKDGNTIKLEHEIQLQKRPPEGESD